MTILDEEERRKHNDPKLEWKYIFECMLSRGYHFDKDDNLIGARGKILALSVNSYGYPQVGVYYKGKYKSTKTHRFKAFLMYGDKIFAPGIKVRHKNDNKLDWSNENIILGTQSDNVMDMPTEKRTAKMRHALSFVRTLTDDQVQEIRKIYKPKITTRQLALEYGVDKATILNIINFKVHTGLDRKPVKLSNELIDAIRTRYAAGGISQQQLADEYGVNQTTISEIIRYEIHKKIKARNPLQKITYEQADEIRKKYNSNITIKDLCKKYGVGKTNILNVIHNKTFINI